MDDLAAGVPGSDGSAAAPVDLCGAVVVRYGVAGKGLAEGVAPTLLGQFVSGAIFAEAASQFGAALAACDFNGDDYDDLAVGVPFRTVVVGFDLLFDDAGVVEIYYGTSAGLVPPASTTRREVAELTWPTEGAHVGWALACGDFDDDNYDDLAVGLPHRDLGTVGASAGRINVYSGAISGLGTVAQEIDQDSQGMEDVTAVHDRFGSALAAGDFDGDGASDLAIGAPVEGENQLSFVGTVTVLYGALFADGFESADFDFWSAVVPSP